MVTVTIVLCFYLFMHTDNCVVNLQLAIPVCSPIVSDHQTNFTSHSKLKGFDTDLAYQPIGRERYVVAYRHGEENLKTSNILVGKQVNLRYEFLSSRDNRPKSKLMYRISWLRICFVPIISSRRIPEQMSTFKGTTTALSRIFKVDNSLITLLQSTGIQYRVVRMWTDDS